jgi:D-tyrosyl-tRNA(Tyr) deacylase
MRAVLQRVTTARVLVAGEVVGAIDAGLLILVGVEADDDAVTAERIARKSAELRIFPDNDGRFDRSLTDVVGAALVVSQFTLLADTRRGRRPSFTSAAPPEAAEPIIDAFVASLRRLGVAVATGKFGADMQVELTNDGPVTIILDSHDVDRPRRG